MRNGHILRPVHRVKRVHKHLTIFWNHTHTLGQNGPDCINAIVKCARHLIFLGVAGHFELRRHRENGLCSQNRLQPCWQPFLCRGVEAIVKIIGNGKSAVMKQNGKSFGTKVPQRAGIARHPLLDAGLTDSRFAVRPNTNAALANAKRQTICTSKAVVMTCAAGNVLVSRQDFVIEKKLSNPGTLRRKTVVISFGKWRGIGCCTCLARHRQRT